MNIEVVATVVGITGIGWLLSTIVRTLVIPRPERVWLTFSMFEAARRATSAFARQSSSPERRHRIHGTFAPVVLITLPLVWSVGLIVAFALVYIGLGLDSFRTAIELSGSSLTTLGFAAAPTTLMRLIAIAEALIGLAVVALMIGFLPTIYGTFSKREVAVGRLTTRAGEPPSPSDFLIRLDAIGGLEDIGALWSDWEDWFAELGETHTSFPALIYSRSAGFGRSWISAAEAALDTAAIVRAAKLAPSTGQADTMIRAGYLALRAIADLYRLEPEAAPGAPGALDELSVKREWFDAVMADMDNRGLSSTVDGEQAWQAFAGWRINYDQAVVGLRRLVGDVPTHWTSASD